MTDAHCHVSGSDPTVREFLVGRDFFGVHPWESSGRFDASELRARLLADPEAGVGEIGLDRLRAREIPQRMREVFRAQLEIAAELRRPVVLHGAKCWGEVVRAVSPFVGESGIPTCLFHGFSRSDGLLPDIVRLNGFVSVGPAILNDHAVNYRELVKKIPRDRLLVETDRDSDSAEDLALSVREVAVGLGVVLGMPVSELEALTDRNAGRFHSAKFVIIRKNEGE